VWITTKQVADQFGVTMRRVRQIAKDRGIEGRKIGSVLVWTQEQVELMQPRKAGAGSHTRNIICKQLAEDIEKIRQEARSGSD